MIGASPDDSAGAIIRPEVLRVVLDTNVLTSALLSEDGASRSILRACLQMQLRPVIGQTLLSEYEDVLGRTSIFRNCVLPERERWDLLDALLSVSDWVKVYYSWRPNLPDEADNHLIELAVAGVANYVVTYNYRDLQRAELRFPAVRIAKPADVLKELR